MGVYIRHCLWQDCLRSQKRSNVQIQTSIKVLTMYVLPHSFQLLNLQNCTCRNIRRMEQKMSNYRRNKIDKLSSWNGDISPIIISLWTAELRNFSTKKLSSISSKTGALSWWKDIMNGTRRKNPSVFGLLGLIISW